MRTLLLQATYEALSETCSERFLLTERGYHGNFYCALVKSLTKFGLIDGESILEMEYQKSTRHHMTQRPDIVFHKPAELTGASQAENNYAVWALKRRATVSKAQEDFNHLDEMFQVLNYPLGFFINIDAENHLMEHYGKYSDRVCAFAVQLHEGQPRVTCSCETNPREPLG